MKFDEGAGGNGSRSSTEIESAVRQLIDKTVVSEGVVDVFDAVGIQKPDVSILSLIEFDQAGFEFGNYWVFSKVVQKSMPCWLVNL